MGTDIHIQFEKLIDGKWESLGKDVKNKYHEKYPDEEPEYYHEQDIFDGPRCYSAFAILANVRNGSGFAGCDLGDGFNVIAYPKGFPEDMSPEVKKWTEIIEHTPSWLTLKELLDFDWEQITNSRIYLPFESYKQFKETGKRPFCGCGDIMGAKIVKIDIG